VSRTLDRSKLVAVQIPRLDRPYRRATRKPRRRIEGTTAPVVERIGAVVRIIPGDTGTVKIRRCTMCTWPKHSWGRAVRAGIGSTPTRSTIPSPRAWWCDDLDSGGLAGHSDADVVCHAIADALARRGQLGDLVHFPNSAEWKDASSIDILVAVSGCSTSTRSHLVRRPRRFSSKPRDPALTATDAEEDRRGARRGRRHRERQGDATDGLGTRARRRRRLHGHPLIEAL